MKDNDEMRYIGMDACWVRMIGDGHEYIQTVQQTSADNES